MTVAVITATMGSASAQSATKEGNEKFGSFFERVNRHYVDSVHSEELVEVAIKSVLKELDPHSVYLSKNELKRANEPLKGNFEGIGIQFQIVKDTIVVVSPISGGPSEKLGIRPGDRIVKIEDKVVAGVGFTNDDVRKHLRGKKGSEVQVSMFRKGMASLIDYRITRDKIPIFSVDAFFMATPDIGYLKLNRFAATTMKEFRNGLDSLNSLGMKHLILDLRGNSGGYLNTAIKLADEFLPSRKLIVYTEGRNNPRRDTYATSQGGFEKGKLVVLINEGSASASEIVSGAIQDWDRGLIIGRRSFGKGLVQKPYALPDGSAIRLTISRYYTPTGRSIQRPYDKGSEEYRNEITQRYSNGEIYHADSIEFPDSLKYYTPNKRIVYGGGGITPDIFVGLDTSGITDYYREVRRAGLLNEFTLTYIDRNRNKLKKKYPDLAAFKQGFNVDTPFLKRFTDHAAKEGVELNEEQLEESNVLISSQLKALIARGLWNTAAYYEIYNFQDSTFLRAIEAIEGDTFEKLELSYK